MSKDNRDLLVGLDIGTSKVVALVAELAPDGQFNVVGVGQTASKGLKKGVVVNIEATVQSIQRPWKRLRSWLIVRSFKCSRVSPVITL